MSERPANKILRALPAEVFHELSFDLRPYDLQAGTVLYEPEDHIEVVWFPVSGVITVKSLTLSGGSVGTSSIGPEGGAGLLEACGAGRTFSQCIVQVSGRFFRLPAKAYCDCFDASKELRTVVQAYSQMLLIEARRMILCQARHQGEERFAWLLLEMQGRLGGGKRLPLTQEDIADIMGVQRTTVTGFAGKLKSEGIIDYRRGSIDILDREKLERAACGCHATLNAVKRQLDPEQLGAVQPA